ncbi:NifU family protein [Micromonospora eburnea]|uniref:NifU family protein n=1 Tax=Micromonospora eburnea TaxID=227316 RepID=UPI001FC92518|nr:NifU family protein [Micromonospora eburnea]
MPFHPQADPRRPERVRWILPGGVLPVTDGPVPVPPPLAALLADGTLTDVTVAADAVVTDLTPGRRWVDDGPRVRTALHAALGDPAGWCGGPGPALPDSDESVRRSVRRLLDGSVGDFVRSHGGSIELVGVRDGVVRVRLAGACDGCPAARYTLRNRVEAELRRHHAGLNGVVEEPSRADRGTVRRRAR